MSLLTSAATGRLIHKCARLLGRGQDAEQIEISAPDEDFIRAEFGWIHPQRTQLGEEVVVDVVIYRWIPPDKSRPCRHEGQSHRFLTLQVTHQHRGVPGSLALDQSIVPAPGQPAGTLVHGERTDV